MKTQLLKCIYLMLLIFPGFLVAQEMPPLSESYWVVERNDKGSFVYIYDAQHQILYQEFFKGKRIDPKRKSVKKKLDHTAAEFSNRKLLASRF